MTPSQQMPMTTDQHWLTRAACTPEDGKEDIFDYDPHRPHSKARSAQHAYAQSICQSCPVIDLCLIRALDIEEGASAMNRYEIRGGLTPQQRAALDPTAGKRAPGRNLVGLTPTKQPPRTHCKAGHALTDDNTRIRADRSGTRLCRTCDRETRRASRKAAS